MGAHVEVEAKNIDELYKVLKVSKMKARMYSRPLNKEVYHAKKK